MAETTREMVVRLTMDAGGFKKTAAEINRQIKNIDSEIKNMGSSGDKKSLLEEKLGLQKTAVDNLKQAVSDARTKLQNANTEKDKLLAAKQLSGLETSLANAEEKAAALQGQLSAVNLMKFSTLATNFGQTMRTMGRTMSLYVSAPLLALGGKAYQNALGFESATASMQKTIDETDATKYEDIKNSFLEISNATPPDYKMLMELAAQAGSLDVSADQVVNFSRVIAMLNETADDLDASTGAEKLAKLLNITEEGDFTEIENAASAVTALGNNMAAKEGEILNMGQRMASTGELAGFATEEILGLSAGFVSVGIEAEMGGSAAGKLMKRMQLAAEVGSKAVDEFANTNMTAGMSIRDIQLAADDSKWVEGLAIEMEKTKKEIRDMITSMVALEQFSELTGTSIGDFSKSWDESAANTMLDFFQGLYDLEAKQGEETVLQRLQEMGLTEIRLSNLIAAAATNPELFRRALEISDEAYRANTALAEEAQKRYDTAESYQRVQLNRMENASADAGENIVDVVQPLIKKVSDLAAAFGELDEEAQDRWIAVAGALIAVGPVSTAIGLVSQTVGKIVGYIGKIKSGDAKAFTAIMSALAGPAGGWILAGVGIAGIIAAIESIETPSEKIISNLKNIKIELDEESYDATMAALAEVKAQSDALAGETGEYNKNVSAAVKAGYGTADMYGTALGYEAAFTQQQISDIAGQYAARINELNSAIGAETDAARQAALAQQRDDLQAQWDSEVSAAQENYMSQVDALVSGMMRAQPEAKAALEQAAKDYDLLVALMDLMNFTAESTDTDAIAKKKAAVFTPEVIERFFPGATEIGPSYAIALQEMLLKSMNETLNSVSGEDSLAYTLLQSILGDPLASGLFDPTLAQGALDGIIEVLDFKQAGETAGNDFYEALTPGLADAVTKSIPEVEGAMDAMSSALESKAAKMGAAMSAAFAANLKLTIPSVNGSGAGTTINVNNMTAQDVYRLRRALTDAAKSTAGGYGA